MPNPTTDEQITTMLAEARADVAQADQKASVVLAVLGVGFTAVLGGQLAGRFDSAALTPLSQVIWWVGVVIAVFSVVAAAWAVWPRFSSTDLDKGITYWAHVAAFDDLDKLDAALAGQEHEVSDRRRDLHQLWRVSRLLRTKYSSVRWAIALGALSALLLALASVVIR